MNTTPTMEHVLITTLKMHPKNYKTHPPEQIAHIMQSLKEHGFYRNVVIARESTILAGHGIVQAATQMGLVEVPVIRLNIDPNEPRALKVMTSDNELGKCAETDDRLLTDLLQDIMSTDDLLGTGFDDMALANLLFITRGRDEIKDKNEAAEWVGMPEFDEGTDHIGLNISFKTTDDRERFIHEKNLDVDIKAKEATVYKNWSIWWPPLERSDNISVRIEEHIS